MWLVGGAQFGAARRTKPLVSFGFRVVDAPRLGVRMPGFRHRSPGCVAWIVV
ncbi:hypothetical protein ACFPRL_22735 [Pseudoclavibacter helvolus]